MIFSIGYQRLPSPEWLRDLAERLDAVVIDVRAKPSSRKRGWGGRQLETALGTRYQWHGDKLGGIPQSQYRGQDPPPVSPEGIRFIVERVVRGVLLCMEEAPGECHRHLTIAVPLLEYGVDVRHIYQQEVVLASELQRSIEAGDDDEYECAALDEVLG